MALVTLTGPDGRRALPVFSSLESLAQWDSTARPVPVECRRAAVSAVAEGCERDGAGPGRTDHVRGLPPGAVGHRPGSRRGLPAHQDPDVAQVLAEVAEQVPGVVGLRAEPGQDAELHVVVLLLDGSGAGRRPRPWRPRWPNGCRPATLLRERVDGIRLSVARAG